MDNPMFSLDLNSYTPRQLAMIVATVCERPAQVVPTSQCGHPLVVQLRDQTILINPNICNLVDLLIAGWVVRYRPELRHTRKVRGMTEDGKLVWTNFDGVDPNDVSPEVSFQFTDRAIKELGDIYPKLSGWRGWLMRDSKALPHIVWDQIDVGDATADGHGLLVSGPNFATNGRSTIDAVADAIRRNELPVKPLPGLEDSGICWTTRPITLVSSHASADNYEQIEMQLKNERKMLGTITRCRMIRATDMLRASNSLDLSAGLEINSDRLADAVADAVAGIPPRPFENRDDHRVKQYDPDQHIGVFGLDAHALKPGSFLDPGVRQTMALILIKSLEQMRMAFSVIAFRDVLIEVDGRLVYIHQPIKIKCDAAPPDAAFWRQLQTLIKISSSKCEASASWPPVHFLTLASEMNLAARHGKYSAFHMNYVSARAAPMESIIDSQSDRYRRAADHIDMTIRKIERQHSGHWDDFRFICKELKLGGRKGGAVSQMSDYHS